MSKTKTIITALSSLLLISLVLPLVMAAGEDLAKPGKECTMKNMHECTMKCTMNCEKNIKGISDVIVLLDGAVSAMDAGKTADAKKEIEKAKVTLKDIHMAQKKCMDTMPTVNDRCPISGKAIDMMNTPEKLTTLYQGKKVGFCCPDCPPLWEKLTNQEKDKKLEKAMPVMSEKADMMKDKTETRKSQEKEGKGI